MRNILLKRISTNNCIVLPGISEQIDVPNQSIDAISAAQSFHWFNIAATKREFSRILKERNLCVLLWNERDTVSNRFTRQYESLLYSPTLKTRILGF